MAPLVASPIWIQLALPAFRIKMCVSSVKLGVSQCSWAVAWTYWVSTVKWVSAWGVVEGC